MIAADTHRNLYLPEPLSPFLWSVSTSKVSITRGPQRYSRSIQDLRRIILTVRCLKNGRRRPVPLTLEQNPEDLSSYDQPLDDSTALQDAAVKSATSLIAVVNDMLKSPLASARLPPQSSSLAPNHGRPRSRTAPSTPLVEAPTQPPLVELPGSIPDRPRVSYHHSFEGKLKTRMSRDPRHDQPCKSARRPSHPWLQNSLDTKGETSTGMAMDVATHTDSHHSPQYSQWENATNGSTRMRASLPCASTAPQMRQSHLSGIFTSRHGLMPRKSDPRLPRSASNLMRNGSQPLVEDQVEPSEDDESTLCDMAALHASHEYHMATTVEAHRREVTSLRMYITFLEQRRELSRTSDAHAHASARPRSAPKVDGDLTKRLAVDLPVQGSAAERSYLSRKEARHGYLDPSLDPHCKSYAGYGEIWLECNHLRDGLETCRKQVAHAEETISRMQRLELSLKNENDELRSRLLAANNERMDVQEGLYEACRDLQKLSEREANLIRENKELRCRSLHAMRSTVSPNDIINTTRHKKSGHCRTRSDVSYQHTKFGPPLTQNAMSSPMIPEDGQRWRVEDQSPETQQKFHEHDADMHITARKSHMPGSTGSSAQDGPCTTTPYSTATTKDTAMAILHRSRSNRKERLQIEEEHDSQTDELQPREQDLQGRAFNTSDSGTPQIRQNRRPTTPKVTSTSTSCVPTARTPSPSPSLSSSKSSSSSPSALGISLPQTPRIVTSTTAEALPMPMKEHPSFARPRTPPAGVNKRLPKPPPLDSDSLSPPAYSPVIKRAETMKSVGGSIIELYAGRGRDGDSEWERENHSGQKGWAEWV